MSANKDNFLNKNIKKNHLEIWRNKYDLAYINNVYNGKYKKTYTQNYIYIFNLERGLLRTIAGRPFFFA